MKKSQTFSISRMVPVCGGRSTHRTPQRGKCSAAANWNHSSVHFKFLQLKLYISQMVPVCGDQNIHRTPQRGKRSCRRKREPLGSKLSELGNGSSMRRRKAFTEPPSAANTLATANWNHSYHKLEWAGSGTSKKQSPNPPAQGPLLQHARTQPNLTLSSGGHTFLTRCQILPNGSGMQLLKHHASANSITFIGVLWESRISEGGKLT